MAYKYQTLCKDLKVVAESLPENSQMPSVRNLMDRYGVSQATVDKAINELRAQRIIDAIGGEGFFVKSKKARRKAPARLKVCLAQNDYPSSFFAMIEETFERLYTQAGHEFQVVRYPWAKGLSSMLKPGLMDGFITMTPLPEMREKDVAFIKSLNIPSVCNSQNGGLHGLDSVSTDFELGGKMAAGHLLALGHKRLAFLVGEPYNCNTREMFAGFKLQCGLAGVPAPVLIDCGMRHGDMAMRCSYLGLSKALKKLKGSFTGLFCPSDCSAIGALRACHENHVAVPDELSIVGFNSVPESEFSVPSITTFKHDLEAWVNASLEIIKGKIEGASDGPKTMLFAPELIRRESTGKPPR